MKRIKEITDNIRYKYNIELIKKCEVTRKFCKHGFEHLLDTARIAYILNLEEKLNYPKEIIYAAALLHDIGRADEYLRNIPHDEAGMTIAAEILKECNFTSDEIELVVDAISCHRGNINDNIIPSKIAQIIKHADKLSRACIYCDAVKECKWSDKNKNMEIEY